MRFLRKLRNSVLGGNRFTRYLIYAVGEIALVVVGILIAVQINNWNEHRKVERLELILLDEMVHNLKADIEDMGLNKRYHEMAMRSANIILSAFASGQPQHDSLNKYYGKVSLVPKFVRTETAYKSLQDNGLRIVQNDSLRIQLTQYYEDKTQFLIDYIDAEWHVQFQDSREVSRKYFKEFEVFADVVPWDYEALKASEHYTSYLNNRLGWSKVTVQLYADNIGYAKALLNAIKVELDRRG